MVELGLASYAQAVECLAMGSILVMFAAGVAGVASHQSNASGGILAGLSSGGLGLWFFWGAMA